jgi:cyclopropane-fatty-acyl-phospholipid synthase
MEKYDVNVIGLTLSKNQQAYCNELLGKLDSKRTFDVRLEGWEQFHTPVDRIVSIEAFEHFGRDRWDDFFAMANKALPDDGVMLLHTITALTLPQMTERGMPLTFSVARFVKFILTEIFPGGYLPTIELVGEHAGKSGFGLTRTQSLQSHYARTLDLWAEALEAHKDEAVAAQSEEVYDRYMHYLTGCATGFRVGYIDVNQFTLAK